MRIGNCVGFIPESQETIVEAPEAWERRLINLKDIILLSSWTRGKTGPEQQTEGTEHGA